MSKMLTLQTVKVVNTTFKATCLEVGYRYNGKTMTSHDVWFPSKFVDTSGPRIRVDAWIVEAEEKELAKRFGYRTVEILVDSEGDE